MINNGTKATVDAYSVSKATIYRWKKRLKDSDGRLESLIPNSKAPKTKRRILTPSRIITFIKNISDEANRTLQEEFIDDHEEYALEGIEEFNSYLIDYLVWYNTKRVHKSLGNVSPIDYLLKTLPRESHMYVTYTFS